VAAVLALAALMPDFRLLNTSPDGLALIADLEGCRLTPYQCSAGVWTSGIGHTAGVVPKRDITEREAAANLVADAEHRAPSRGLRAGRYAAAGLRRAGQFLF
jgi:lysozyme